MSQKIDLDHGRFRQIIRGKIKQNLRKYISQGEMIAKKGKDTVAIPIPQVEIPPLATSHCLDDRVVPHPAAVEIAGGDEERRARIVSPQQRKCNPAVVGVTVVKRYRGCALRQRIAREHCDGAIEWQQIEPRRDPAEDSVERRCVGNIRQQRIVAAEHAMEDQDRQARPPSRRRHAPEHVLQDAHDAVCAGAGAPGDALADVDCTVTPAAPSARRSASQRLAATTRTSTL